jgi:hypothetical protein
MILAANSSYFGATSCVIQSISVIEWLYWEVSDMRYSDRFATLFVVGVTLGTLLSLVVAL